MFIEFKTAVTPQHKRFFNIQSTKDMDAFYDSLTAVARGFVRAWPIYFGMLYDVGAGRQVSVNLSIRYEKTGCVVYAEMINGLFAEIIGTLVPDNTKSTFGERRLFFKNKIVNSPYSNEHLFCFGVSTTDPHETLGRRHEIMIVSNTHLVRDGCLSNYELLHLALDEEAKSYFFFNHDVGHNCLLRSLKDHTDGPGRLVVLRQTDARKTFITHFEDSSHEMLETRFITDRDEKIVGFREWVRSHSIYAECEAQKLFRHEEDLVAAIRAEIALTEKTKRDINGHTADAASFADSGRMGFQLVGTAFEETVMEVTPRGMSVISEREQPIELVEVTQPQISPPTTGAHEDTVLTPAAIVADLRSAVTEVTRELPVGTAMMRGYVFEPASSEKEYENTRASQSLMEKLSTIANTDRDGDEYEKTPIQFRNPRIRIVDPVFGISANAVNLFEDDLPTIIKNIGVFERSVITHPEYTGYVIRLCAHAAFYAGDDVLVHSKDDAQETISVLIGGEIETVPEEWNAVISAATTEEQTTFFFNLFMKKISDEYEKTFGQEMSSDEWAQILSNYESGLGKKFMVLMPDATDKLRKSMVSFCTWVEHLKTILPEKKDTVCYYDHKTVYAMTDVLVSWDKMAVGGSPAANGELILTDVESVEDAVAAEQAKLIDIDAVVINTGD